MNKRNRYSRRQCQQQEPNRKLKNKTKIYYDRKQTNPKYVTNTDLFLFLQKRFL